MTKPPRFLSDHELALLMALHSGVDPAKYLEMVDVEITLDADDADEETPTPPQFTYAAKLRILLQTAHYGPRPH